MINTLNETHLHKTLKTLYQIQSEGKTEVLVGNFIADIVAKNNDIIEIQTGSLGKLLKKIEFFISEKKAVKVVYPLVALKYIETKMTNGKVSTRKSPIKKNIYSVFRELTGLVPILLNKNFTIEIIECEITEERIKTNEFLQSKNNRRRFRKDWQKTGKRLEQIGSQKIILHGKASYKKLLPKNLPQAFSSKDFFELLQGENKSVKRNDSNIMLWLYTKLEILKIVGKQKNAYIYSIKTKCNENA